LNEWLTQNAGAPSRMAPKFAVGPSPRYAGVSTPVRANRDHLAISIEPETESQTEVFRSPASGTIQYEFAALGSDLNTALRVIGERARSLTRGTSAAIALSHNGSVICRASVGASAPALGTRVDASSGFSGECFRAGKSLRCDDAETDPRVDLASCRRAGIRSILAAPIRYDRDVVGLLAVFATHPFSFDEGDVAVVESLAHTVVLAMSEASALKRS
jgi:GAF domain-containing protein